MQKIRNKQQIILCSVPIILIGFLFIASKYLINWESYIPFIQMAFSPPGGQTIVSVDGRVSGFLFPTKIVIRNARILRRELVSVGHIASDATQISAEEIVIKPSLMSLLFSKNKAASLGSATISITRPIIKYRDVWQLINFRGEEAGKSNITIYKGIIADDQNIALLRDIYGYISFNNSKLRIDLKFLDDKQSYEASIDGSSRKTGEQSSESSIAAKLLSNNTSANFDLSITNNGQAAPPLISGNVTVNSEDISPILKIAGIPIVESADPIKFVAGAKTEFKDGIIQTTGNIKSDMMEAGIQLNIPLSQTDESQSTLLATIPMLNLSNFSVFNPESNNFGDACSNIITILSKALVQSSYGFKFDGKIDSVLLNKKPLLTNVDLLLTRRPNTFGIISMSGQIGQNSNFKIYSIGNKTQRMENGASLAIVASSKNMQTAMIDLHIIPSDDITSDTIDDQDANLMGLATVLPNALNLKSLKIIGKNINISSDLGIRQIRGRLHYNLLMQVHNSDLSDYTDLVNYTGSKFSDIIKPLASRGQSTRGINQRGTISLIMSDVNFDKKEIVDFSTTIATEGDRVRIEKLSLDSNFAKLNGSAFYGIIAGQQKLIANIYGEKVSLIGAHSNNPNAPMLGLLSVADINQAVKERRSLWPSWTIPIDKSVSGHIIISLNKILVRDDEIDNVSIAVNLKEGVANIENFSVGSLFGGEAKISGSATFDATATSIWSIAIKNSEIAPIFRIIDPATKVTDGLVSLVLTGTATGSSPDELIQSIKGGGQYKIRDMKLDGVGINDVVDKFSIGINEADIGPLLDITSSSGESDFKTFDGAISISNGIMLGDTQLGSNMISGSGLWSISPGNFLMNSKFVILFSGNANKSIVPMDFTIKGAALDPNFRLSINYEKLRGDKEKHEE